MSAGGCSWPTSTRCRSISSARPRHRSLLKTLLTACVPKRKLHRKYKGHCLRCFDNGLVPLPSLFHHSDRRSQYASHAFQARPKECGMVCKMSRKGNRLDNAPMESFFYSLKNERVVIPATVLGLRRRPTSSITSSRYTTVVACIPRSAIPC